jgi:DNA repair exonuclease SbcCD ATPase subunit
MRILKLTASNYKKLKAVEITPDANMQIISGANAAGKSAVLDAIWAALGGSDAVKGTGTTEPIREGQGKAQVQLDLGDLIVTRKWTKSGSTITVESKDGAVYKSPQSVLDELIGRISLDPLSFANSDERTQRETLMSIVQVPLDLAKNAADRRAAYDERTSLSRDLKTFQARMLSIPLAPEGTPDAEISTADIIREQSEAIEVIRQNNSARALVTRISDDVRAIEKSMQNTTEQMTELQDRLKRLGESLTKQGDELKAKNIVLEEEKKKITALHDPDLTEYSRRLSDVETINRNVRNLIERKRLSDQLSTKEKDVENQTNKIEALDRERQEAISAVKFPIPDLSFNDVGVLYKGIPFAQCSSAEKLRVSVSIAMAVNPKLRVIIIKDGSLIDSKNMSTLEEITKANDYQVWIERVDETGKIGIFIEDGEVVSK